MRLAVDDGLVSAAVIEGIIGTAVTAVSSASSLLFAFVSAPVIAATDPVTGLSTAASVASDGLIHTESQNLWPFLIYAIAVVGLLALVLVFAWFASDKTARTESTDMQFESGVLPVGSADQTRLTIEFYLIAMFFVIFDLETIFILAWAVAFFELGWRGYVGASIFIVILLVALVYEWRTGALDWGVLRRGGRASYARSRRSLAEGAE